MRILLVEDSADIAEAIETRFRRDGHSVTLTADGHDGEAYAISGEFDVMVLDINLPGQDGFAILRAVRASGVPTPVLVVTARNQIADKVSLLDLGADDYLVKPFDLSELSRACGHWRGGARGLRRRRSKSAGCASTRAGARRGAGTNRLTLAGASSICWSFWRPMRPTPSTRT